MALPNNLPQSKSEYLKELILFKQLPMAIDAALVFYHCEVPLEQAKQYMQVLADKLSR